MTDENLCDFRGVNISESLHGVEVVDADFSFGEMFTGQLVGSFANCRFRGCRYEGCVSKRFGKCDFSAANLTRCVLDGEFEDCSFIGTNFNHARGAQLRFTSCAFAKASFRGSAFYDAIFRRCSFEACEFNGGSLAGSTFVECEFETVSVIDMSLNRVTGFVAGE